MDNRKPIILALISMVLWGLSYPINRIFLQYIPAVELAFFKYGTFALLLLLSSFFTKVRLPRLKDVPIFAIAGLIGISLYNAAFNYGLTTVTSATSGMIMASSPIVLVILARIILKEKLDSKLWLPILFQFSGVLIISFFDGVLTLNIGVVWVMIAMLFQSMYSLLQRTLQRYRPIEVMTYCTSFGAFFLFLFVPHSFQLLTTVPKNVAWGVLVFAIFVISFSNLLWGFALRMSNSMNAIGNFLFLPSVFAAIFGALILNEIPTISTVVGGVMIIAGAFIFNRFKIQIAKKKIQQEKNML